MLEFSGQIMILIFISGLSSKVKIKVKSNVSPQCLQLRERKGDERRGGGRGGAEVDSAVPLCLALPLVSVRNRKQRN